LKHNSNNHNTQPPMPANMLMRARLLMDAAGTGGGAALGGWTTGNPSDN
jgi:hypothetical protein